MELLSSGNAKSEEEVPGGLLLEVGAILMMRLVDIAGVDSDSTPSESIALETWKRIQLQKLSTHSLWFNTTVETRVFLCSTAMEEQKARGKALETMTNQPQKLKIEETEKVKNKNERWVFDFRERTQNRNPQSHFWIKTHDQEEKKPRKLQ